MCMATRLNRELPWCALGVREPLIDWVVSAYSVYSLIVSTGSAKRCTCLENNVQQRQGIICQSTILLRDATYARLTHTLKTCYIIMLQLSIEQLTPTGRECS